jgi:hypothetical protein
MRGRVYERRSDVSADGSLFLAFVRQSGGAQKGEGGPRADTWLAVSRPPYFSALAVWLVGGTYHTGGFFPDSTSLWTGFSNAAPDIGRTPRWLKMTASRDIPYVDRTPEWSNRTVHFNRLLRDGWRQLENDPYRTVWERQHPSLALTLSMSHRFVSFQRYGGSYAAEYAVRDRRRARDVIVGPATWADWDQHGRLTVARDGCLVEWTEDVGERLIADFNGQTPDPGPAPAWALEWPPAPAT